MRLPDQRKILREDIKTKETWVSSLIDPINSFMNIIYIAFNGNITFEQNIRSIVKQLNVDAPSTYPTITPIRFPNTMAVKARGLVVVQAYKRDDYTPVPGPVYASWIEDDGMIVVSGITGLTASTNYSITFLVF